MEKNQLKTMLKGYFNGEKTQFSAEDNETAVVNALREFYGIDPNMSYKQIKRRVNFDVVEEALDEVLPKQLENIMGGTAQIKLFGRNEECIFTTKGLGKRRALLSIVPGARAGVYKARRLDKREVSISTRTYTAGVFVQLEEILLGTASLSELMANILDGIQYQIYADIVRALRTIKTQAPAANKYTSAGLQADKMDNLIRIVSAYGTPVIVCFHSFAVQFNNMVNVAGATPNFPVSDIDEVKNKGFVSVFHGTPVIEVPNYLTDEKNESWIFSEADAFVLPTEAKPVLVAMQGEGYIEEVAHNLGGAEWNYHKMMGTGILVYNNLAIYTDSAIAATENGAI